MAKIRDDLDGVVFPYTATGIPLGVALRSGDEVPAGAVVGAHLLAGSQADEADEADEAERGAAPKGNASREVWADYAVSLGITVPDDAGQREIRALVAEHQA